MKLRMNMNLPFGSAYLISALVAIIGFFIYCFGLIKGFIYKRKNSHKEGKELVAVGIIFMLQFICFVLYMNYVKKMRLLPIF